MFKNSFCFVGIDMDFDSLINKNKNKFIGFFSKFKKKKYISSKKHIGDEQKRDWERIKKKFDPDVFILIDEGKDREKLHKEVFQNNVKNLILEKSNIEKKVFENLKKRKGILIQSNVFISSNVKIADGVKIHSGAQIHHDVSIGKYSTIAPSSLLLGSVVVGNYSFIGANSTIKQNIKIGNNSVIGAGAVVVKDVKDNETVAGNPAKKI